MWPFKLMTELYIKLLVEVVTIKNLLQCLQVFHIPQY